MALMDRDNQSFNETNYNKILYLDCSSNVQKTYHVHGFCMKNWLIVGTVNLLLAPVAFFMNFIMLIALRKSKDKNTITNYMFTNLCISDMSTGLVVQPLYGALYLTVFHQKTTCSLIFVTIGFGYFFVAISFLALLGIHVERYLGVFHPFYHNNIKTDTSLIKRVILAAWMVTAILVALCFLTKNLIMYTVLAAFLAPTAFICSCYVQVKIVRQVGRITTRLRKSVLRTVLQINGDKRTETERRCDRIESRANRIAGLILIAYTVCYIPNLTAYIWSHFDQKSSTLLAIMVWTETLVFLNSIFNPLLFCLQKKDIREVVVSSLHSLIFRSSTTYGPNTDTSAYIVSRLMDKQGANTSSLSVVAKNLNVAGCKSTDKDGNGQITNSDILM